MKIRFGEIKEFRNKFYSSLDILSSKSWQKIKPLMKLLKNFLVELERGPVLVMSSIISALKH